MTRPAGPSAGREPGRTLSVREGKAFAARAGVESLIATMTGTLMALQRRAS